MSVSVVLLPGSVSRLAGGLFTSVRRLSETLSSNPSVDVSLVGHRDQHTDADLAAWRTPPHLLRAKNLFGRAAELRSWFAKHRPDLIHTQFLWSYASLAGVRWQRGASSTRFMISPRGMLDPWALSHSRWKKRLASAWFERRHLESAACLHALNESEAESIRAFGLRNPICILPNGIDLPDESPVLAREPNRSEFRMLFLGRVHPKKGLLQLIRAWSRAGVGLENWQLEIAGWDDGGHLPTLQAAVDEFELQARITFAGPLHGEKKSAAFRRADAFVLPSHSEGMPIAVLEAWSHRLPVLMTSACNLPIGFANESAMEIETDPKSLAKALVEFSQLSEAQRMKMGGNGRALVEREFQWKTIAAQQADVYHWVLGHRDRPPCIVD